MMRLYMMETNFYDALDRLKTVWQWTREANLLKLKPFKCCLMYDRVPFLGHYISRDGVEVNPMKTGTPTDAPAYTTESNLQLVI